MQNCYVAHRIVGGPPHGGKISTVPTSPLPYRGLKRVQELLRYHFKDPFKGSTTTDAENKITTDRLTLPLRETKEGWQCYVTIAT